ncbi:hypothetical protein Tco_0507549, partial [Tanacetum coccineum]
CPNESKILADILNNHPLRFSIAACASVPWIYMSQFWHILKEDRLISTNKTNIIRKPSKTGKHEHGNQKSTKEAKDSKPKPEKVKLQSNGQTLAKKSQLTKGQIPNVSFQSLQVSNVTQMVLVPKWAPKP